jgi:DNA-binding winged helix-turn-helix (wHTH) protein
MRQPSTTYRFGPFCLDVAERRLSREGTPVPLRLKVFETLRILVGHGRLLTKDELIAAVWPATAVEGNNPNHHMSAPFRRRWPWSAYGA